MALLGTGEGGLELRDWHDETRRAYATEAVENPDNTATTRTCFVMSTNTAALAGSLLRTGHDELQELCEDLACVTGDETYLRMLCADVTLEEPGAD